MTDTRSEIAKLIQQLQVDTSLLDKLRPTAFERVATELVAQQKELLEVGRLAGGIDVVGRYRDELQRVTSFAIEAKQLSQLVDTSSIAALAKQIEVLNLDRAFVFTTSSFTEAARRLAAQYRDSLQLIDGSGIRTMLDQYVRNQEEFASALAARIRALDLEHLLKLEDPSAESVEHLELDRSEITERNRDVILSVARLPFKLIAKILRSPQEIRNLTPRQFEEFVADVLAELGFTDIVLTPRSGDGGKDVIASNMINGIPLAFYFECKKYAEGNKVQLDTLRTLLGTMAHEATQVNKGVLVTTSTFTRGCRELILSEARLDGKDYDGVLGWVDEIKKRIMADDRDDG